MWILIVTFIKNIITLKIARYIDFYSYRSHSYGIKDVIELWNNNSFYNPMGAGAASVSETPEVKK